MLQKLIFLFLFISLFSFCDATYQYDVYVNNTTDQPLQITFKSHVSIDGPVEKTITIPSGKTEKIISSIDISPEENSIGTSAAHCKLIADYITAYLPDGTPATIEWCNKGIHFEKTDLQQGGFTIKYTKDNF